jgi:hypothetical protein
MSDLRNKKLAERRKKIKERSEGSGMVFIKADQTLRVRPLPVNEEEEFGLEITQFYFNAEIKGVISAATFGEPCPIMEMYNELKEGDDGDRDLASKIRPKAKYVVPVLTYSDLKGESIDDSKSGKLLLLTGGVYQQMIDYFLDEEQGDFTDPKEGYDIKVTRTGSGMTNTEYSTVPCRPSKLPKKYNKIWDIEAMLRSEVPSYEEAQALLNRFLNIDDEPKKKKKKTSSGKTTGTKKKKVTK